MSNKTFISAYTPSNTNYEVLNRIFVQRIDLRKQLVRRLHRSLTNVESYHPLLIGPRGSGKTNLISLIIADLQQNKKLAPRFRLAWLGEDDSIPSFNHLTLAVAESLKQRYPNEFKHDYKALAHKVGIDQAGEAVMAKVQAHLQDASLLIVMENLDRALLQFKHHGQQQLRAYLQEHDNVTMLTSSQQLFNAVNNRSNTLFGFFHVQHLAPLNVEDARQLIVNISQEQGNTELKKYVQTPAGRVRTRALHHLAGGNHRLYVILAEVLTKDTLEDLIGAFEHLADELTPYYQERIRSLSAQQEHLIQELCSQTGAKAVKDIAQNAFVDERSCAKQLGELKKKGYVKSTQQGKQSFYEIAEPLMRLCLEAKRLQGQPMGIIIQFLQAWFPAEDIQEHLKSGHYSERTLSYLNAVKTSNANAIIQPIKHELMSEIKACNEPHEANQLKEELNTLETQYGPNANSPKNNGDAQDESTRQFLSLFNKAQDCFEQNDFVQALTLLTQIIQSPQAPTLIKAMALYCRGVTFGQLDKPEEAINAYTQTINMKNAPIDLKTMALCNRGGIFIELGKPEEAVNDYTQLINMQDAPTEQKAKALYNRGVTYRELGKPEEAVNDYTQLINMKDAPTEQKAKALLYRGITFSSLDKPKEAVNDYTQLINMQDAPTQQRTKALLNRGTTFIELGKPEEAVNDYTQLINMQDAPTDLKAEALLNRGVTFSKLDKPEEEINDYTQLINMQDAPTEQKAKALYNRGATYKELGNPEEAVNNYTQLINMQDAPTNLKDEALLYRGSTFLNTKQFTQAVQDFNQLIPTNGLDDGMMNLTFMGITTASLPMTKVQEFSRLLKETMEQSNADANNYLRNTDCLLNMILAYKQAEWLDYITLCVELFKQYNALPVLGKGLTQEISTLDSDDYSASQRNQWLQIWQKVGEQHEDLKLPLLCLKAGVDTINRSSPLPLMELPAEIRVIVRPLLNRTLGEES